MRRRITYANVVATLALVLAMSGGAVAASSYLITSTKQIKPNVLRALKGKKGKTGIAGAKGATGPAGPTGAAGKEATIPALAFHELTLEDGWVNFYTTDYGPASYAKDIDGFVHLSGAIDGETKTGEVFATLPAGFRPAQPVVWLATASTDGESKPKIVDIQIESNGKMSAQNEGTGANEEFISLEGVTFYSG